MSAPQPAKLNNQAIDLIVIFEGKMCEATRERVINFLFPVYRDYSNLPVEKAWDTREAHEEFFLPMPTLAAYASEMELCRAILWHSRGDLTDEQIRAVLIKFVDTHIWIYQPCGPRINKVPDKTAWVKDVSMFYVTDGDLGFTVNAIQAHLLKLLEAKRGNQNIVVTAL